MTAHFFDIETLIDVDSKVWIISKNYPQKPLIRISQSEFKLIELGIFTNKGEKITIGTNQYWVSSQTFDDIKRSCKKNSVDITNISFSMQEFTNPEIIDSLDFKIHKQHLVNLRNSQDHIYLICSKNTLKNYEKIIDKLVLYLESIGLKLHKYYALSETFYNREEDKITQKKNGLFLQHLTGFKTESEKFTDNQIEEYDTIVYYDTDSKSIEFSKRINNLLKFTYDNSEESIKENVKNKLSSKDKTLVTNLVTFNLSNPYIKSEIKVNLYNLVKSFESFRYKF